MLRPDEIKMLQNIPTWPSAKVCWLTDDLQRTLLRFFAMAQNSGIPTILTSTARSQAVQDALYLQGRSDLKTVNEARKQANMRLISDSENLVVTWTHNSKHVVKELGKQRARAFDVAVVRKGQPTWDYKVNINGNQLPDYLELAQIGRSLGLRCGADFKSPDYPHFEL